MSKKKDFDKMIGGDLLGKVVKPVVKPPVEKVNKAVAEKKKIIKTTPKERTKPVAKNERHKLPTKKERLPFTTMLNKDLKRRLKIAAIDSDNKFTVADLIEKYIIKGLNADKY